MNKKKLIICIAAVLFIMPLAGCIFKTEDSLIVGSRNNTESIILSQIMGQLIEEKTDINVTL